MEITIVGAGDTGSFLAERLLREGHKILLIDRNGVNLERLSFLPDVLTKQLDLSEEPLPTKVFESDAVLLLTDDQALNISLATVIRAKNEKALLAVRTYGETFDPAGKVLKAKIVNAVERTAETFLSLVEYPPALAVWKLNELLLLKLDLKDIPHLRGRKVSELSPLREKYSFLLILLEEGKHLTVPSGETLLPREGKVYLLTKEKEAKDLLKELGANTRPTKEVLLIGLSRYTERVLRELLEKGVSVKMVEPDFQKAEKLLSKFPQVELYEGKPTERELLFEENLLKVDAILLLSEEDERNLVLAAYYRTLGAKRVLTLLQNPELEELAGNLPAVPVMPKRSVASEIYTYLKGNPLLKIVEISPTVEIFEETYGGEEKPLRLLKERKLIVAVEREGKLLLPKGDTFLKEKDKIYKIRLKT